MKIDLSVVLLLILGLLLTARIASQSPTTRQALAQDTVIQGYPCAKGYAWFYPSGHLNRCAVSSQTAFGEARIPAGSIIQLRPDGTTQYVMLAHNTRVAGYDARGGSFLGPSEGDITAFYPSGQLRSVYLVGNQTIQGVPCRGGQWAIFTDPVNGGDAVEFYKNGTLRSCKLTRDYGGGKSGHRIVLPAGGGQ